MDEYTFTNFLGEPAFNDSAELIEWEAALLSPIAPHLASSPSFPPGLPDLPEFTPEELAIFDENSPCVSLDTLKDSSQSNEPAGEPTLQSVDNEAFTTPPTSSAGKLDPTSEELAIIGGSPYTPSNTFEDSVQSSEPPVEPTFEPFANEASATLPASSTEKLDHITASVEIILPDGSTVDRKIPPIPRQDYLARQSRKGQHRATADGFVLNFNNLIFTNSKVVEGLQQSGGYSNQDCSYILQYYLHVVMVYPSEQQIMLQEIFTRRKEHATTFGNEHLLHELDPLRLFAENRGVPPKGFKLCHSRAVPENNLSGKFRKGSTGTPVPGFPPNREPLPIGITLHELAYDYPNHIGYEFLDAFLQHGISAPSVVRAMRADVVKQMEEMAMTGRPDNMMTNRFRVRRDMLIKMVTDNPAGRKRLDDYMKCDIKLLEVGTSKEGVVELHINGTKYANFNDLPASLSDDGDEAMVSTSTSVKKAEKSTMQARLAQEKKVGRSRTQTSSQTQVPEAATQSLTIGPEHASMADIKMATVSPTTPKTPPPPHMGRLSGLIIATFSAGEKSLGRLGDKHFFRDDDEWFDFIASTRISRDRQLEYLQMIANGHPDCNNKIPEFVERFQAYYIDTVRTIVYGQMRPDGIAPENTAGKVVYSVEGILAELSSHCEYFRQKEMALVGDHPVNIQAYGRRIKKNAVDAVKILDELLTALLAISLLELFKREQVINIENQFLMSIRASEARGLCQLVFEAKQAQTADMAGLGQRLISGEPIVDAIMYDLANRVENDVGLTVMRMNEKEWLKLLKKEAEARIGLLRQNRPLHLLFIADVVREYGVQQFEKAFAKIEDLVNGSKEGVAGAKKLAKNSRNDKTKEAVNATKAQKKGRRGGSTVGQNPSRDMDSAKDATNTTNAEAGDVLEEGATGSDIAKNTRPRSTSRGRKRKSTEISGRSSKSATGARKQKKSVVKVENPEESTAAPNQTPQSVSNAASAKQARAASANVEIGASMAPASAVIDPKIMTEGYYTVEEGGVSKLVRRRSNQRDPRVIRIQERAAQEEMSEKSV